MSHLTVEFHFLLPNYTKLCFSTEAGLKSTYNDTIHIKHVVLLKLFVTLRLSSDYIFFIERIGK